MKKCILILGILICNACDKDVNDPLEDFTCQAENITAKSERTIGIDLLDLTENNTFDQNIMIAKDLGVEFIALHLTWLSIEPTPNTYEDPFDALELLSQYAAANNLKFSLTIRPIDLTGKTVPTDLDNTRFNDVKMINRFKSVVDFIFSKLPPSILLNLQIGNEIDGYNTSIEPSSFWDDYSIFLQEITAYAHTYDLNLKIGFTGTFKGMISNPDLYKDLLQNVDILGVTYYPLQNDFSVKDPDVVFHDFDDLVSTFGDYPIYLQEIGYQSSPENNSSETKQAMFYCNLFKAWDIHPQKIKAINMVRLNDLSLQSAEESAGPYGISNNKFIEYLRTLGIRTFQNEGTNKEVFQVIKENMSQRGW